jgi:hypothetical protein
MCRTGLGGRGIAPVKQTRPHLHVVHQDGSREKPEPPQTGRGVDLPEEAAPSRDPLPTFVDEWATELFKAEQRMAALAKRLRGE